MARGRPKKRVDNAERQHEIMAAAKKEILPPDHVSLNKTELKFFASIINEKAKADWTDHELELAAMLSRSMNTLNDLQRAVAKEGIEVDGKPNRKIQFSKDVATSIIMQRRALALYSHTVGGGKEKIMQKRKLAKQVEKSYIFDDDLIARPNNVH